MQAAASIIRIDIRAMIYPLDAYPMIENLFEKVDDLVPESLKLLLTTIVKRRKKQVPAKK